jgi:hypothetical protein
LAQKETPAPQMFTGYPVDDHDLVYEAWMRGEFGNRADFRRRNIEKSCQKVRDRLGLIFAGDIECCALKGKLHLQSAFDGKREPRRTGMRCRNEQDALLVGNALHDLADDVGGAGLRPPEFYAFHASLPTQECGMNERVQIHLAQAAVARMIR